ncbi:Protein of unknown function (DUF1573) [Opitutaceae bacterium TAV1]|nr:Protein of unknown function (DUF1573) [Opitutaceae bacterium TAV1]
MIYRLHPVLSCCLLATAYLPAALVFETTTISQPAQAGDTEMVTVFRFKNTGGTAEEITKLDSSCGCTVPELEKRVYQPGEAGEIKAVFTFGDRTGRQGKEIRVRTAAAPDKPVVLRLETVIPELLSVSPRALLFRNGAQQETSKSATLTVSADWPLEELTAVPENDALEVSVSTHPVSGRRILTVQRPDASAPARTAINVTAKFANGVSKTVQVRVIARTQANRPIDREKQTPSI